MCLKIMNCAFCEKPEVKARIIIENDLAFAFPTHAPIVAGHTLITPKRHLQYYEDLTAEEKNAVEDLRFKLNKAFKKVFGAQGFNYAWNEEIIGGQSVPHFHLHILPRKEGDSGIYEYEPRGFLYQSAQDRPLSPQEELIQVVNEIKKAL